MTFEALDNKDLHHLFVNRVGKSLDHPLNSNELVQALAGQMSFPSRPVASLKQVHKNQTVILDSYTKLSPNLGGWEADAIFTNRADLYISIRVADCLPLYVYDAKNKVIGLIHAGWRGTLLQITNQSLKRAKRELGLDPSSTLVLLGPSIRPCCYNVSPEVGIIFPAQAIERRGEKWFLDLFEANRIQLLEAGVEPKNIFAVNQCTYCTAGMYYSFRRTGNQNERMYAILGLR